MPPALAAPAARAARGRGPAPAPGRSGRVAVGRGGRPVGYAARGARPPGSGAVRAARGVGLPIVLVHDKESCEFDWFFQTTPADLIAAGIYKTVATELLPPPHNSVSAVHLFQALGAKTNRKDRTSRQMERKARRGHGHATVAPA